MMHVIQRLSSLTRSLMHGISLDTTSASSQGSLQSPAHGASSDVSLATTRFPFRVVFLSPTATRSHMAAALLRARGAGRFHSWSTGSPPETLHPLAVKVMGELGQPMSEHDEYAIYDLTRVPCRATVDLAVLICDENNEACPTFSSARRYLHWHFPDPACKGGDVHAQYQAFRWTRDLIASRINMLINAYAV